MNRPDACKACGAADPRAWTSAWEEVPLWRCRGCGSAFAWPVPDARDLRRRYRQEHEAGKWEAFFREVPPGELEEREGLLAELAGRRGRLLDVGCGGGEFLALASARGWEVVGTELDRGIGARARRRSGSRVVVGPLEALAESSTFDAVTFWDVLEHLPEPWTALALAFRRLAPGGVALATMPNAAGVTARLHGPRWKYYDLKTYGHLYHLSPAGLEALFRRGGYRVEESRTLGATDLRYVPGVRWGRPVSRAAAAVLDRLSGLLARISVPTGLGNTLLVAGRRP